MVTMAAIAERKDAVKAEPPLKPNQPNQLHTRQSQPGDPVGNDATTAATSETHMKTVPMAMWTVLCGRKFSSAVPWPLRLPSCHTWLALLPTGLRHGEDIPPTSTRGLHSRLRCEPSAGGQLGLFAVAASSTKYVFAYRRATSKVIHPKLISPTHRIPSPACNRVVHDCRPNEHEH